jgi:hypothetical protein
MNQEEEIISKASLALNNQFFVELINRAMATSGGFVGKIKKVCEILELENQLAASVRYAAILARDYPTKFQEIIEKEKKMGYKLTFSAPTEKNVCGSWNETIKISPKPSTEAMTLIAELSARHPKCQDYDGAHVVKVSGNKIIIFALCSSCRDELIKLIMESLVGKKPTILGISIE